MQRLLKNIGWLLTGRGLNAVLSIVYLALATRTLGLDNFGYFAIILALGQTVTGLANFQTWQFVVRWGADELADATGFAIALDLLSMLLGLVLAAVLVSTAPLWLPLPDDLLPLAFGYCVVSLLAILRGCCACASLMPARPLPKRRNPWCARRVRRSPL